MGCFEFSKHSFAPDVELVFCGQSSWEFTCPDFDYFVEFKIVNEFGIGILRVESDTCSGILCLLETKLSITIRSHCINMTGLSQ